MISNPVYHVFFFFIFCHLHVFGKVFIRITGEPEVTKVGLDEKSNSYKMQGRTESHAVLGNRTPEQLLYVTEKMIKAGVSVMP